MTAERDFSFPKKRKLKKKSDFDCLFSKGSWAVTSEIKILYLKDQAESKTGVVAGKKLFKKAVHRNRVKRLLREAYRLQQNQWKEVLGEYTHMLLIWNSYHMPKHLSEVQKSLNTLLQKLTPSPLPPPQHSFPDAER